MDGKADNAVVPYDEREWNDPLCLEALEACPWKNTDHDRGEGPRRENYCTWCEGYVTARIKAQDEIQRLRRALDRIAEGDSNEVLSVEARLAREVLGWTL